MNCRALACCFGTVLMLAPCGLNGQAVSGSITGIVTDPSGAAVSNAAVSVENTGTSLLTRTTTTNGGFYTVEYLLATTVLESQIPFPKRRRRGPMTRELLSLHPAACP